jgi:excinuclease ABC subunit B
MRYAIDETNRRRAIQMKYNEENGITPQTIIKPVRDVIELRAKDEIAAASGRGKKAGKKKDTVPVSQAERDALITELTAEMKLAAKNLEFERAAYLRDRINEIKMASATSK